MSEKEEDKFIFLDNQMKFMEDCEEISTNLLEYFKREAELANENTYVPQNLYLRELKRHMDENREKNLAELTEQCAANTAGLQRYKIYYEEMKKNSLKSDDLPYPITINPTEVKNGPNDTIVDYETFYNINWRDAAKATTSLTNHLFSPEILATHSLTSTSSPTFYGLERAPKQQLDPKTVEDIIYCVKIKSLGTEREIRRIITTRCADLAKN